VSEVERDVAERLSEALNAVDDRTVKAVVDRALNAEKTVWATVICKKCAAQGKYEVDVPDSGQAVKALEALLRAREKPAEQQPWENPGGGPKGTSLNELNALAREVGIEVATLDDVVAYARKHDLVLRPRRDGEAEQSLSELPPATPPPPAEIGHSPPAVGPSDSHKISLNGNPS
jgi:hypothetical protein